MESLGRLLWEHPFVQGLRKEHVEFLEGCAANVRFSDGDVILKEGGSVDKMLLVRHGQVALRAFVPGRGHLTVAVVGEGEFVGWSGMVEPYVARFDAVAVGLVRAIALDAVCLRRKCEGDAELGYAVFARVADALEKRLQATRVQLLDLYGRST